MNKTIKILLLTLAMTSAAKTAWAQKFTKECRNGIVEVDPLSAAPKRPAIFGKGTNYFYGSGEDYVGFVPNLNINNYQGIWQKNAGEMCDKGPNSPILCDDNCLIIDDGEINQAYLRDNVSKIDSCYTSGLCSPGIGNGIIQPSPTYGEECDDGNITDGDGCSKTGKIELAEKFIPDICGNGVKDAGEECDDGNNRNNDGCSSVCEVEVTGEKRNICNNDVQTCGNGQIDYALGEQCDEGDKNGLDATGNRQSDCRENCVLWSSPSFAKQEFAYWSATDGVSIDSTSSKAQTPSKKTRPRLPKELIDDGKGHVENHGQRFVIEHAPDEQYSGIILTDQKIDDLKNTNIYKDGKIHLNLVISPEGNSGTVPIWDDDAIGIAFGVKYKTELNSEDGKQELIAKNDPDYKYLLLSWRSLVPFGWGRAYVYPRCEGNNSQADASYGPPGLRLYQVFGAPSYTQLWTMRSDCQTDSNGDTTTARITEVDTSKSGKGNMLVNPFLPLNTFYAYNFQKGDGWKDQRLQIDAEFSLEELKVWVNKVLAIHIIRKQLDDSNLLKTSWPETGQLGFYFLGMDKFRVDTSGTFSKLDDEQATKSAQNGKGSQCKGFCGNGVKDATDEKCDDGNTNDFDGCTSKCKFSDADNCETIVDASNNPIDQLCYGGDITSPTNGTTVASQTPTISGTYDGAVAKVVVTVVDKATGKAVPNCTGDATLGTDGTWEYPTNTCNLSDNKEYEVLAKYVPIQSTQGNTFPTVEKKSSFNIDISALSITPVEPKGNPAFQNIGEDIWVKGKTTNADSVTVKICDETPPCTEINPNLDAKNEFSDRFDANVLPTGCQNANDVCTITYIAKAAGKPDVEVSKTIKFAGTYTLEPPEVTNLSKGKTYIPNSDKTLTVQGKQKIPTECEVPASNPPLFDSSKCAEISIKVTIICDGKQESKTVKMNSDGTYSADVPLNCGTATSANIRAVATDTSGKEAESEKIRVRLKEKQNAKISIKCPRPTSSNDSCELLNGKEGYGLVVNGQTNIQSQRPVVVSAYKKTPGVPCDFAELQKGTRTPDASAIVKTSNNGKWAADLKHLPTGDYCIVADLKNEDGTQTIATNTSVANNYQRKGIANTNADKPIFVSTPTDVAAAVIAPPTGGKVPVTVTVDDNSHVIKGDKCVIYVEDNKAWKAEGTFDYDEAQGKWLCTADLDAKNGDQSLLGKKLVAVVQEDGKTAPDGRSIPSEPLTVPAQPTLNLDADGKAILTFEPDYPVTPGETIHIVNADRNTEIATCEVQNDLTCKTDEALKKDGIPISLLPKGTITKIYATNSSDVKITDTKTIEGTSPNNPNNPVDGKTQPGDSNVTGNLVLNKDGSATVTDIEGAKPGDVIKVTATKKDGSTVGPLNCLVQADNTCTTELFGMADDFGQAIATTTGGLIISEWTASSGFVAGGCSTTNTPASTLISLLLAALGLLAIRRRD